MSVFPLPAPEVVYDTAKIGPAPGVLVTIGATTWVVGNSTTGFQTVSVGQLDQAATFIEKLIQQDYSVGAEFLTADIDADGAIASFKLEVVQVNDLPDTMKIGACIPGAGKLNVARSFAKLVRLQEIGTEWAPPA